ncbi:ABC transporter ATP-binding protein [Rhizobiales bacterium]|uniref:ABC transporter ATP-binding protein n=1 Tax=Hongsoonwoonella zoysiae TaxID=2821844 RepID=UPI00155F71C7|nr:ABC transporter ATP-binding protein [Hongsoonwoonella zoysiae]NRG17225.1 ABC transporter ATP-binding protein [Hongsoonwoonella zoysiae]
MPENSATLDLRGISKRFGHVVALRPTDLTIPGGGLVALLGPSGCGKTTTLRIVAGFERPDTGSVIVGGRDITNLPPNRRGLGMVFQNYSLFPHMSVAENIAFGLKMAGRPAGEIGPKVGEALEIVRLPGFGERFVHQLSGGQQQRVALARSIVTNPSVLLLDEPLGALDKNLRESMQFELRQLQANLGITTVLVTHDQEEALTMSDSVAVMRDGHILQFGSPAEVYDRPRSRFVAEFLGTSNIIEADVESADEEGVSARSAMSEAPFLVRGSSANAGAGGRIVISVRPEKIHLTRERPERNYIAGRVAGHVFRGNHHAYQIDTGQGGLRLFANQSPREFASNRFDIGDSVNAAWSADDAVVLSE